MTASTLPSATAPDPREAPRAFLEHLYRVAVDRALPLSTLGAHLPQPPKGRTVVLGAGKAGGSMVQALEALWPADAPLSGLVVTRYDHIPPRPAGVPQRIERLHHRAAGLAGAQHHGAALGRLGQVRAQRGQRQCAVHRHAVQVFEEGARGFARIGRGGDG